MMKKYMLLLGLLVSGLSLFATDPVVEQLTTLCKPYVQSKQLNLEILFYRTTDEQRKLVEKIVLKRNNEQLFLKQNKMAILSNSTVLIQADKQRKKLIISHADSSYADKMFAAFNPTSFLSGAVAVRLDSTYAYGKMFEIKFSVSSPYSREEIYFNPQHEIQKIVLKKKQVDPLTGQVKNEVMEMVYTKAAYKEEIAQSAFSPTYFFSDVKKYISNKKFKGYQVINYQNQ